MMWEIQFIVMLRLLIIRPLVYIAAEHRIRVPQSMVSKKYNMGSK